MDSVVISEDSLEHAEHGTQNGTQYPAFHPSNAATGQLLLLLHTGLAYLRNRYFMFSLQFHQANQDIIEHQKTAQSEKFDTVNKSVKGMTNTVRSHCNHVDLCLCLTYQPELFSG